MKKKVNKSENKVHTDFKNGLPVETSFIYLDDTDPININSIDFNKIKTSKKKVYSRIHNTYRYYKGYYDNNKLICLIIELPQTTDYCTIYKNNDGEAMNFVCNDELLKIHKEILKDISIKIGKELNSDSIKSNDNMHIKAKIDEDRVLFHGDRRPKLGKQMLD